MNSKNNQILGYYCLFCLISDFRVTNSKYYIWQEFQCHFEVDVPEIPDINRFWLEVVF